MNFIYALCGWEGSAADARVLRDVVTRNDVLKVLRGYFNIYKSYYLLCVYLSACRVMEECSLKMYSIFFEANKVNCVNLFLNYVESYFLTEIS